MKTWRQRKRERAALIRRLEREFKKEILKAQEALRLELGASLARLDVDENGNIIPSANNMLFEFHLKAAFDRYARGQQSNIAAWFVNAVKKILGANKRYFNSFTSGGPHDEAIKIILKSLGFNSATKKVAPDSWLDELIRANGVRTSILRQLGQALAGGLALSAFLKTIDKLLKGAKGLLSRFLNRVTGKVFVQVDNATQNFYAKKLGLNYALYAGTIMDKTRPFCVSRTQNVYSREEIESWQELDWAGKIPGADVKIVCGGYNCRHHLSWISDLIAQALGPINVYN